jgi:hypothetical protein
MVVYESLLIYEASKDDPRLIYREGYGGRVTNDAVREPYPWEI